MSTSAVSAVVQDVTVSSAVAKYLPIAAASMQAAEQDSSLLTGADKRAAVAKTLQDTATIVGMAAPQYAAEASLAASLATMLIDPLTALFNHFHIFQHKPKA